MTPRRARCLNVLVTASPVGRLGYVLPQIEQQFIHGREESTRAVVEVASAVVENLKKKEGKGGLTREQAQALAIEEIKALRYGRYEYFWINDFIARMVMHPLKPALDGQNIADMKDPNGQYLFREMVEVVKKEGAVWCAINGRNLGRRNLSTRFRTCGELQIGIGSSAVAFTSMISKSSLRRSGSEF